MNKFLKEILEQPSALERTLNYYVKGEGKKTLHKIKELLKNEAFEQIIFTGMGSSYFTSFASQNMFSSIGISSFVINTSELLHYNFSILKKKTLLVCLSQSGESFEVVEVLKKIPKSVTTIGVTNAIESSLAKESDITLLSWAGSEEMTSTKTYVSVTLVVYILGWFLSGQWNKTKIESIENLITNYQACLEHYQLVINDVLKFLGELQALQIIARGSCYSPALQSALMFKEAIKVSAAGYLGGEFRHGPMEMVQNGFKSILLAPKGKTFNQNLKMAQDIVAHGGKVILITNADVVSSGANMMVLPIQEEDEFLFSIQSIIPIQLIIDYYAKSKGFEAGSFSHGAKVTIQE
ncbi:MAG: SIS domain-containing protein [Flavobacteriaceae bacterium]|nr:SIS domain-containing protein [Flavobacteriaceae bacterium]